jgi:hypothetical protein
LRFFKRALKSTDGAHNAVREILTII